MSLQHSPTSDYLLLNVLFRLRLGSREHCRLDANIGHSDYLRVMSGVTADCGQVMSAVVDCMIA